MLIVFKVFLTFLFFTIVTGGISHLVADSNILDQIDSLTSKAKEKIEKTAMVVVSSLGGLTAIFLIVWILMVIWNFGTLWDSFWDGVV